MKRNLILSFVAAVAAAAPDAHGRTPAAPDRRPGQEPAQRRVNAGSHPRSAGKESSASKSREVKAQGRRAMVETGGFAGTTTRPCILARARASTSAFACRAICRAPDVELADGDDDERVVGRYRTQPHRHRRRDSEHLRLPGRRRARRDDHDPWRDVYLNYKQYGFARGASRQVQAAVQPRREHQRDEPRLRLPVAHRRAARAGTRSRAPWSTAGSCAADVLRYELGLFNEDGSNARTFDTDRVHGERTLAGRVLAQPFRSQQVARERPGVGRRVHDERSAGRRLRPARPDRVRRLVLSSRPSRQRPAAAHRLRSALAARDRSRSSRSTSG